MFNKKSIFFGIILSLVLAGLTFVDAAEKTEIKRVSAQRNDGDHKIYICHKTSSETNPYVVLHIDESAADGEGANDHTHHEGDIIPIDDRNGDGEITVEDCTYEPGIGGGGEEEEDDSTGEEDSELLAASTVESLPNTGKIEILNFLALGTAGLFLTFLTYVFQGKKFGLKL